jgi:hypothetical protein
MNEDPTDEILDEVAEVLENESELVRLERYVVRIGRALGRLGVLDVVDGDWACVDAEKGTISFAPIPREKLLFFAGALEDRVDALGLVATPVAGAGQRFLDLDLAPLVFELAVNPHLGAAAVNPHLEGEA